MSAKHKSVRMGVAAKSVRKSVRRVARMAARETGTALAVVADGLHAAPRVVKHAGVAMKSFSGRTERFVKSNPMRALLGAAAFGFIIAKARHLV
jgi:hypothetical protein